MEGLEAEQLQFHNIYINICLFYDYCFTMVCFYPIGSDEWTQTLNDVFVRATLTVWGRLSGLLNLFTSAWAGGKGHIHSPVVTLITSRFVRHTRDGLRLNTDPPTALHSTTQLSWSKRYAFPMTIQTRTFPKLSFSEPTQCSDQTSHSNRDVQKLLSHLIWR